MTDKEIIKALDCLKGCALPCRECPYSQANFFPLCQQRVAKDALDLIKRQQQDISTLKTKCYCISNDRDRIKKRLEVVSRDLQEGSARLTEAEREKFWAMTDEEIREFWEQLSDYTVAENENRVIPAKMFSKLGHVSKSTIDIIKRLNAENDDLTERLNATIAGQESLQKALAEKDREVSVLNSDLKLLRNDYDYLKEKFDKAIEKNINQRDKILKLISERNSAEAIRAEAVREFAERLKEEMHKYCGEITEDDINNLVKKMVGED